jgi:hypothetical protein
MRCICEAATRQWIKSVWQMRNCQGAIVISGAYHDEFGKGLSLEVETAWKKMAKAREHADKMAGKVEHFDVTGGGWLGGVKSPAAWERLVEGD